MIIYIKRQIVIKNYPKELIKDLTKMDDMRIMNPKYLYKKRKGQRMFGTPKYLYLFEVDVNGLLILGVGLLNKMMRHFNQMSYYIENIQDLRTEGVSRDFNWNSEIVLRDYQLAAVDKFKEQLGGLYIMPAGSGKTITGIATIDVMKTRALWLTHTTDLMRQSAKNIEMCLGFKPGIIGGGTENIHSRVNVATLQTLANRPKVVEELAKDTGLVIVDEAHRIPTKYFYNVLKQFYPEHILGLTATPDRADGFGEYMRAYIGPIIYEIDREKMYAEQRLIIPELIPVYTEFDESAAMFGGNAIDMGGDGMDYHKLLTLLKEDGARKELIAKTIVDESIKKKRKALVLSEWVEYAEEIIFEIFRIVACDLNVNIQFIFGGTPRKERESILNDYLDGKIDVLFATKLAREGLDLPNIEDLYLTTPKKGDTTFASRDGVALEQEVGRCQRKDPGNINKIARIFDFVDELNGIFNRQWASRKKTYKRLGIKVPTKAKSKKSKMQQLFSEMYDFGDD